MVGAKEVLEVLEGLLLQGDSLVEPARRPVGDGEVNLCGEGVGVVGSQDAGVVGEVLLVQGDGLVEPAGILGCVVFLGLGEFFFP